MGAHVQGIEPLADYSQEFGQIEKLAASSRFLGSESLCHLLRFLADKSLNHPAAAVNEYEIADEVFRRGANFDPRNDATVRVHMGRLRSRIADYYANEGAHDPIVVELPPRSYAISFLYRGPAVVEPPAPPVANHKAAEPRAASLKSRIRLIASCIVLAAMVCYFVVRAMTKASAQSPTVPKALAIFWKDFLDGPAGPLVVFSNAKFIGTAGTGLRYFRPNEDSPDLVVDQYTGIGELMGIDVLNHLFFRFGREMRVRRALNMSWDDAKASSVIFLGSELENEPEIDLPHTPEFVFRKNGLVNLHPHPGEAAVYSAAQTHPETEDYAVISLHYGLTPAHRILILAGGGTLGTQAAAEFVCIPSSVQELLSRVHIRSEEQIPNFEAVVRVKVSGGVPIHTDLVALHTDPK